MISQVGERRLPAEDLTLMEGFRSRLPKGPEAAWVVYQLGDLKAAEKLLEDEFSASHKRAMALKSLGPGDFEAWPSSFFAKILREIVSKQRYAEINQALEAQAKHFSGIPHYEG